MRLQRFVIVKGFEAVACVFFAAVLRKKLLAVSVYAIVHASYIQKKIKNVIACYNTAFFWEGAAFGGGAVHIVVEKRAFVERNAAANAKLFGNYVEHGAFAASVAAVKNRNRLKFKAGQLAVGKHAEGICAAVTGFEQLPAAVLEFQLAILRRKGKNFQDTIDAPPLYNNV